jgi:hypothetical protein
MTNEEIIRRAYDIAEAKDIQGWIDGFTPDGVFVDHSVEATYVGPTEVAKPVEWYGAAFSNMLGVIENFGAVLEPLPA